MAKWKSRKVENTSSQNLHEEKIALVTGANSGIGRSTARGLAGLDMHVLMLCRNRIRGEEAKDEIVEASGNNKVDLLLCDLASLDEVRRVTREVVNRYNRLDIMVNNAGIYRHRYAETNDGLEKTWAVNYFAPFLMTNLLTDQLKATAERFGEARIVNVSSNAHRRSDIKLQQAEKGGPEAGTYNGLTVYAATKLAIVLFTRELARRLPGSNVLANVVDPGMVNTSIWLGESGLLAKLANFFSFFYASAEVGASGLIRAATDPELKGISGQFFKRTGAGKPSDAVFDEEAARRLWEVSEKIVGLKAE